MRVETYPAEITIERTPLGRLRLSQGAQLIYVDREALRALVEAIWRVGTNSESDAQSHKVTA